MFGLFFESVGTFSSLFFNFQLALGSVIDPQNSKSGVVGREVGRVKKNIFLDFNCHRMTGAKKREEEGAHN